MKCSMNVVRSTLYGIMLSPIFINRIKITNNSLNLCHRIMFIPDILFPCVIFVYMHVSIKKMLSNMKFVFNNSEN